MSFLQNVRVVIRELFAPLHVANRFDPDAAVLYHCVAIRIAGVIDESRFVPIDRGIDDDVVVDREQVRVMPLALLIGIASVGLGRSQTLACILDQPRSRGNPLVGKSAQPLNG